MDYRSSIRHQVSMDVGSSMLHTQKKKCCQKVAELMSEVVDTTVDRTMEYLLKHNQLLSGDEDNENLAMLSDYPIREQDECDDANNDGSSSGLEDSFVDSTTIAKLMTPEVWRQTDSYAVAEVRETRAEKSNIFKDTMIWLDEILATAKAEFSTPDIAILPKTPAVKKKRKATVRRKSSVVLADPLGKMERPSNGRTRRAVSVVQRLGVASTSQSSRCTRSKPASAPEPDDDLFSPAESRSIPKKIARFSHLPHVKDKVDAFEKISDSPSFERAKPKRKKVTKSTSRTPDTDTLKKYGAPAAAPKSDDDHTPLVSRTVNLHTSTPTDSASAPDEESTLTKQSSVRSRLPAAKPAILSDISDSSLGGTPQTVKKFTMTKQPATSIFEGSPLLPEQLDKAGNKAGESSDSLNKAVEGSDSLPQEIPCSAEADFQTRTSDRALRSQSVTECSSQLAPQPSSSSKRRKSGACKDVAGEVIDGPNGSVPDPAGAEIAVAENGLASKNTRSCTTKPSDKEKETPASSAAGMTKSRDIVSSVETAAHVTEEAVAGRAETDNRTMVDGTVDVPEPVDMELINQDEMAKPGDRKAANKLSDMEIAEPLKPVERPVRSTRTKTRQKIQSSSSNADVTQSTVSSVEEFHSSEGAHGLGVQQPAADRTAAGTTPTLFGKSANEEKLPASAKPAVLNSPPPPEPSISQPQRTTRSKMRAVPPPHPPSESSALTTTTSGSQKSPARPKQLSPARSQSPGRSLAKTSTVSRTRIASADRATSGNEPPSAMKRKPHSDSNPSSAVGGKKARISDSSPYATSSLVRTLTKSVSVSRLNKNTNSGMGKLQTTVSTPDMSRSHSMIKNMMRSGAGRVSPQGTPSLSKTVLSFIKRATPQKVPTSKEITEEREQKLREKQHAEKQRREDAEKYRLQQVEIRKRERMEKMQKVQEARQAKLQAIKDKQLEMEKKSQQKTELSYQAQERKQKEERERALLRDQKLQEVEERRKKEEEKRQLKIKANEAEQRRHADAKRAHEEAERLKKEAERQNAKIVEKARQEAIGKFTADRALQGKAPLPPLPQTVPTVKKTSIYEVIGNKTAALAEERALLRAALKNESSKKKLDTTFTKDDPDYFDVRLTEEEDEFEDPKFAKCVKPRWAQGHEFSAAIINQYTTMKTNKNLPGHVFGSCERCMPDLTKIFPIHKPRFFKRTSSAIWASPPLRNTSETKRNQ